MNHVANILLGAWLILLGLQQVAGLRFDYDHLVLGALAIAAGVMTFFRR
ncbi:MAG: hypothetical protein PHQ14_10425 [Chromatiales bacterium]|jgi:hypothetical protein|nr:hypothetical protein [Chromatiales bacterium]MDX9768541.1 hypothetical protein [Ectothiorhodospiraceae bacterium]